MKLRNLFTVLISVFALFAASCSDINENGGYSGYSDMNFEIAISNITATGAVVKVTPDNNTTLYYFDKVEKSVYAGYKSNTEFMQDMIANLRKHCSSSGTSIVESISIGENQRTFSGELTPDTDYYIFAFGVDSKLNPKTNPTLKAFRTGEGSGSDNNEDGGDNGGGESSDNTFSINVSGGLITITPSNNDPYFWTIEESDYYAGQSESFIISDLIEYYSADDGLQYYIASGEDSYDYSEVLTAGNSYTIYVFGYDNTPTTGLTQYTFTYAGDGSSSGDISTPTGDIAMTTLAVWAYYYGDYYENGANNWNIYLTNNTEEICVECFTNLNASTPVGSYSIVAYSESGNKVGDALAGEISEDGYLLPTYYTAYNSSDELEIYALITSGSLNVTANGDTYTMTANFIDEDGNKITTNYTGAISIEQGELAEEQSAVKSLHKDRYARKALHRFSSAASLQPIKKSVRDARIKR